MPDPDRWTPDPMLIDAATAGRLHATRMTEPDRAYVVATLTAQGETADQIADRLHCSPRLVKRIRGEPLAVTLHRHNRLEHQLAEAEAVAHRCAELRQRDHDEHTAVEERLRDQIGDLVDQLRRTREALDHERAERHRRAHIHLHVYRRQPTPAEVADTTDPLF